MLYFFGVDNPQNKLSAGSSDSLRFVCQNSKNYLNHESVVLDMTNMGTKNPPNTILITFMAPYAWK